MTNPQETAQNLIQEGLALARTGDKAAARRQWRQATMLDPLNETAWLCLAGLAENAQDASQALDQVQALNPAHPQLEKARAWVKQTWPVQISAPEKIVAKKKMFPFTPGLLASLVSVGLMIVLGLLITGATFSTATATHLIAAIVATPTFTPAQELSRLEQAVNEASTAANMPAMIENLVKMRALAPQDEQIAAKLAQLYYEQGLALRDTNNLEHAQQVFEGALAIQPNFKEAEQERRLATWFLTGIASYQKADWAEAVAAFAPVYEQNPDYLYVDEILYSAYYNLGVVQQAATDLSQALKSYQNAIKILPKAPEAKLKAKEVALQLNPPDLALTPTPQPVVQKRIEVDISDQRAYVYENDKRVYNFIISTGEPGSDTAIGEFKIQSKIPMAYAGTWNLDMPYWLGIYWAGPLENGFHALPTVRDTGYTLWDGYLGQRVSYGCIILSLKDSETLYNWAEIDTPVSIKQ